MEFISDISTDSSLLRIEFLAKWVVDPFAPKVYSLIQNNFAGNIGDGLNFFSCEQTILCRENACVHRISIVFIGAELFIQCIVTIYNSAENNMINIFEIFS